METLAFIHTAVAYEDPSPDLGLQVTFDLQASSSIALGLVATGIIAATMTHADQAQATISYGQRGPGVATLQSALGVSRDRIFGSQTDFALRDFQSRRGLAVDGIAGPATLSALGLPSYLGPGEGNAATGSGVTASSLNVRSSPWGPVRYSLRYGESVSLTGRTRYYGGLRWAQLSDGNWVAARYVGYSSGYPNEGSAGSSAYITARIGVNVRNAPDGYRIDGLGYGAPVELRGGGTLYAGGRSWTQLANGGWVATDYIGYR